VNDIQFFSSFFKTESGELLCITKGKGYRNRYILGITKEKSPSLLSSAHLETRYLQDCWTHNEVIEGNENKELFPNGMDMNGIKGRQTLLSFIENRENKIKESWDLNLGFRTCPDNLQLLQAFELTNNRILVSAFTDSESKSAYPDKHTLYYFFVIDKTSGEVLDEIAPYDTTIYKNVNYLIVEDRENERFLFKSEDTVYQISKEGKLSTILSLEGSHFAKFRKLNLIGNTGKYTYFHYRHKSDYNLFEMVAIELGNDHDEMVEAISQFTKNWKEPS
jgi:hypothetical protein